MDKEDIAIRCLIDEQNEYSPNALPKQRRKDSAQYYSSIYVIVIEMLINLFVHIMKNNCRNILRYSNLKR
jgi:hypothetical protein